MNMFVSYLQTVCTISGCHDYAGVVGLTSTYAISADNHLTCEFHFYLWWVYLIQPYIINFVSN